MKKIIFGTAAAVIVFVAVIAVVLFNNFNSDPGDNTDNERHNAAIPTISFEVMGKRADVLRGYREKNDSINEAGLILPLKKDGQTRLYISSEEGLVDEAELFLYSSDQTRLLENKKIAMTGVGEISADIKLTALAEPGESYLLIIRLALSDNTESFYALKTCLYEDEIFLNKKELLAFTGELSNAAREKNTDVLSPYVSYDKDKAGRDLHHVNMYTDMTLLTYGGLKVDKKEEYLQIYEWHESQVSLGYIYTAAISYGAADGLIRVNENFCVRERDGKKYLLDYERDVTEHFYGDEDSVGNTSILLGIQNKDKLDLLYTDFGLNTYFAVDGSVWHYDYNSNTLTSIYSTGNGNNNGFNVFAESDIELISVTDGKLYFTVRGYMESGIHEGYTGIALYGYDIQKKKCREYFYCSLAEQEKNGRLCSVNENGLFFINLGESIYSLDLSGEDVLKIYDEIDADELMVSADGKLAAWSFKNKPEEICILDTSDSSLTRINTRNRQKLFGFIGEDLVYGTGMDWSLEKHGFSIESFLGKVCIIDKKGQEKAVYERDGILIGEVSIYETGIGLKRYKLEADVLTPLPDDILSVAATPSPEGYVVLKVASSESKRDYYYINLGRTVAGEPKLETATLTEAGASVTEKITAGGEGKYLSKSYGEKTECDTMASAIKKSFDSFGSVYLKDFYGETLWDRNLRQLYLTMKLPQMSWTKPENADIMNGMSSLERGVDIFVYAGVNGGIVSAETAKSEERKKSKSVYEELTLCFGDRLIDLTGCEIADLLYYVNLRHPVLCLTGDDSSLIITGYTPSELKIYDPATRETKSVKKEEAQEYFDSVYAVFVSF